MTGLDDWKRAGVVLLLCAATTGSQAQTFTTLITFDGANGAEPYFMSLIQGHNGNLYGTTASGGQGLGTIFEMTPGGELHKLHSFNGFDGTYPYAGLAQGSDGNFYGTTYEGGTNANGSVFKATPGGVVTNLYSFCAGHNCTDGLYPEAALVRGTDGNMYGTTFEGGNNFDGTVFKITPEGDLTTLHSFSGRDGSSVYGGVIQGTDGHFYGTTSYGGAYGWGTVFKITAGGHLTTLHDFSFSDTDGGIPTGNLVQAADGNFYGTTGYGGTKGAGTVFKITSGGALTTLYSFCTQPNCLDGEVPEAGLVAATDGNFYGTTVFGGGHYCNNGNAGCGTIFQLTAGGTLVTLHSFAGADGNFPSGGLLQATNGVLYGTTDLGGNCDWGYYGCGTVFSVDVGLGPFVAFVRDSGKVGATGGILGQGFIGATDVSLNGTPATFTVVSDTYIRGTVPPGATSGFVTVTTPSRTLTSNKVFRVTPQLLSFDPPSGPVGTQVTITGVSLTQTQGIGFGNRVPAQFTVNSDTQVTATVPAGAKTGKIGIETKGGSAISSGTFTVTP